MKLIQRARLIASNVKAILNQDISISRRDLNQLMNEQLGPGWLDRLMAVKGKLHPDNVEKIINNASSRTTGKLGPLFELAYYISTGPRIGGMLEKRQSALTRVNWEIQPGDKDNSQSIEAAQFMDQYVRDIKFKLFLEQSLDGKLYGVTGFQNIIMRQDPFYVFRDPTENQISQSRWWQERSGEDNWGELYLKTNNGRKLFINNQEDVHPAQLSVFLGKYKKGYWDTTGIMMRILRLYVLKVWTLTFLAQSVERHGKPFIWTTLNESQFKDENFKAKVKRVMKQFGAERWGIFPDGLDIDSLDTASASGTTMHIELLNYINVEEAITLLGQNLSTEVQGGSFAAATSHMGVEERLNETDVEWTEEQINDHWMYWLNRINFPELAPEAYAKISLTPQKDVDVEKIARGYTALSKLIDVPVEEIRAKAQSRKPRIKEDAPDDATGTERYDEEVVGPSTTRRARNLDNFLNNLGA